jgi:hypothetical protein
MPLLAATALARPADRAAAARMPLLAAAARARSADPAPARERAAAGRMDAGGRAHMTEAAAQARAAQPRPAVRRIGDQGQRRARQQAPRDE